MSDSNEREANDPGVSDVVDATDSQAGGPGSFYTGGQRYGQRIGILARTDPDTLQPLHGANAVGRWDPWHARYLVPPDGSPTPTPGTIQGPTTGVGTQEKVATPARGPVEGSFAPQLVCDHEAPYRSPAKPEAEAPFGQYEEFTSANPSTRVADRAGRVALTTSILKIVGSEDDRFALAAFVPRIPLTTDGVVHPTTQEKPAPSSSDPSAPAAPAKPVTYPPGVAVSEQLQLVTILRPGNTQITFRGPLAVATAQAAASKSDATLASIFTAVSTAVPIQGTGSKFKSNRDDLAGGSSSPIGIQLTAQGEAKWLLADANDLEWRASELARKGLFQNEAGAAELLAKAAKLRQQAEGLLTADTDKKLAAEAKNGGGSSGSGAGGKSGGKSGGKGAGPSSANTAEGNFSGSVQKKDHPGGYVSDDETDRIGLLGSVFASPADAIGWFFEGRDGKKIGVQPIRHDAQFVMPRNPAGSSLDRPTFGADGTRIGAVTTVDGVTLASRVTGEAQSTREKAAPVQGDTWNGRLSLEDIDFTGINEGTGPWRRVHFGWDRSLRNTNTVLGHENAQIVAAVRIDESPIGDVYQSGGGGGVGQDGAAGLNGVQGIQGPPGADGAPGNCDDCVCDCPTSDYGYGTSGAHFQVANDATFQVLYAETLDLNGYVLQVPDFQVYVSQTLTLNGGKIGNNAEAGGNGATGGPGGAGGSGTSTGTLPPGGAGGLGGTSTQPNGVAGTNVANTFGGAGGAGGAWAGAGGAGGTATPPAVGYGNPNGYQVATTGIMTSYLGTVALGGGGGGGGGSGGNVGTGECGGGGGAGGRRLIVVARNIVKGTGTPSIEARGGNGGNSSSLAEGSGGGGGGGGHITIVCDSVDFDIEAICDVSGGTGGAGATAGQDGDDGWVQLLVRPVPA